MSGLITLPGLVDLHVHLRDPGQTHKEDFLTGTSAALAGGFTAIFDMPNNATPITTTEALEAKIESAKKQVVCDVGFYFGSLGDNLNEFAKVKDRVVGLKLYLNATQGNYLLDPDYLHKIFNAWDSPRPILLHAEADVVKTALKVAGQTNQIVHVCHISSRDELEPVIHARRNGVQVTCGVTPHHLFLTNQDEKRLGSYSYMKPSLKNQRDQDYLWENLNEIDVVESDHAPHTHEDKKTEAFGVPGLETTLPLLLQAAHEGKISREEIIDKCHAKPLEILGLQADPDTYIEVSDETYEVRNEGLKTKCGWSPFAGREVRGRVSSVYIRGQKVYENGAVLAEPGCGLVIPSPA